MEYFHRAGHSLIGHSITRSNTPQGEEILRRLSIEGISVLCVWSKVYGDRPFGNYPIVLVIGTDELELQKGLQACGLEADIVHEVGDVAKLVANSVNHRDLGVETLFLSVDDHSYFGATPEVLQASDSVAMAIADAVQTGPKAEPLSDFLDRVNANLVSAVGKGTDSHPPSSN